jgi:hypothetical protein
MSDGSSLSGPSQRAVLLAFAGLASAIITRITGSLASQLSWLYPGLVVGVVIAAVFVFREGVRSV